MVDTLPSVKEREYYRWDEQQAVMLVCFAVVITVDVIFSLSTFLGTGVNGWLLFGIGGSIFVLGAVVMGKSHAAVFDKNHQPPTTVLSSGLYGHLRHPMYAGILAMYAGAVVITFSLVGLAIFAVYFFIYNDRAAYEERVLERIFGDEYASYKRNVRRWVPKLR